MSENNKHCTASGQEPENSRREPAPTDRRLADGQHADHWVMCEAERAKGFIRPVRLSYVHEKCGGVTSMPPAIAETYAREPAYYGSTFCCKCRDYFPVGAYGQFVWDDGSKVGT